MIVAAPEIINRYFRAVDMDDIDALVACFTDDGLVADEGRTCRGREQIRRFAERAKAAYRYRAEALRTEQDVDDRYVVTTKLIGTFPGSPLETKYVFTLRGRLIGALETDP